MSDERDTVREFFGTDEEAPEANAVPEAELGDADEDYYGPLGARASKWQRIALTGSPSQRTGSPRERLSLSRVT